MSMKRVFAAAAVWCVVVCSVCAAPSDPSVVTVSSGTLKGSVGKKSRSFLGVPFAAPPVGALRWKAPAAVSSWSGVRDATKYGNSCMQNSNAFTLFTKISEDCLYLNVYTPYPMPTKPLPVAVFIYGGSWDTGASSFFLYNPENDIALSDDVVFVTINYRLNAFGFLASESLRAEDPHHGVGNYGFLDQVAALKWVQQNIAAFGGDPNVVTVFGESAGAGSVSNHLLSPGSQGLFHRAAMESGPVAPWTAQPFNTSAEKFEKLAENVGCCSAAPCGASAAVLECLRSRNSSDIETHLHGLPSGLLEWSPVIDGVTIPSDPQERAAAGHIADVPLLFGTNHDEGSLFTHAPKDLTAADYKSYLTGRYGAALGEAVFQRYPASNYTDPFWACSAALGDAAMTCPARRTASWALQQSGRTSESYVYFYTHVLAVVGAIVDDFKPLRCFHGSELVMVFDFEVALWTAEEKALARAFIKYWTNFFVTGSPNGDASSNTTYPHWPAFDATSRTVAVLDVDSILTPTPQLREGFCDFWDQHPVPPSLVFGN